MVRNAIIAGLATLIVPGIATVLVPYLILNASGGVSPIRLGPIELISAAVAIVGAGMIVWVSTAFVMRGAGTPVPVLPPREFVASGLYRFVRNPMYVGALLILLGEALFFQSGWILLYASLIWLALHGFVVLFEEPQLERRFGDSYARYKAVTPRWLPRRPPAPTEDRV